MFQATFEAHPWDAVKASIYAKASTSTIDQITQGAPRGGRIARLCGLLHFFVGRLRISRFGVSGLDIGGLGSLVGGEKPDCRHRGGAGKNNGGEEARQSNHGADLRTKV